MCLKLLPFLSYSVLSVLNFPIKGDRGNDFKVKKGRFVLDIRKKFLAMSVMRRWNRLSSEAVNASSP